MKRIAEYIWIDGQHPVGRLRSKTRIIEGAKPPVWGFDGSSTKQADGSNSDCVLKPVKCVKDPLRKGIYGDLLVLCEVYNADGTPAKNNHRHQAVKTYKECSKSEPIFGIEQEYTLFNGHAPLGWPRGGYAPQQGPFYCGVGSDEEFGAEIAEEHMLACLQAGLAWCGKNGEVMCGQWEFQIGPKDPITVADDLWLARYLLYKIAAKHGVSAKLDPKPNPDLNGAGAHTNFSTKRMREGHELIDTTGKTGLYYCALAAESLGIAVTDNPVSEGEVLQAIRFPVAYGTKFEQRLTGDHETCSYKEFKYGVADRTASIRIPLHVAKAEKGYIEDRRPCADADPYRVVDYIMDAVCFETANV